MSDENNVSEVRVPTNAKLIEECIRLGDEFSGVRVEGDTLKEKNIFLHKLFSKSRASTKKQA